MPVHDLFHVCVAICGTMTTSRTMPYYALCCMASSHVHVKRLFLSQTCAMGSFEPMMTAEYHALPSQTGWQYGWRPVLPPVRSSTCNMLFAPASSVQQLVCDGCTLWRAVSMWRGHNASRRQSPVCTNTVNPLNDGSRPNITYDTHRAYDKTDITH